MSHAILVVDDEPENLDLLCRTLGFDFDVHCAAGGEEALAMVRETPNLALIITDQRMPGMMGTELLRRVRETRGETVRIILTGYTDARDLIDAINSSNVYRYLTKPWDIDYLQAVVRRAVRLYEAGGEDLICDVTGLIRRQLFSREVDREVFRARANASPLALLRVELVGYRAFCIQNSVAVGEQVLRAVADDLKVMVRPLDVLCAWADGVFVVCVTAPLEPVHERIVASTESWPSLMAARTADSPRCAVTRIDLAPEHASAEELLKELDLPQPQDEQP